MTQLDRGTAASGTMRGTWRLIRADLDRVVEESTAGVPVGRLRHWLHLIVPSGLAPALFRVAHLAHCRGWRRVAAALTLLNQRITGIVLHPASRIGGGLYVAHTAGVTFCGTAGVRLSLYPACYVGGDPLPGLLGDLTEDCPRFGDRVRVGTLSVVQGCVSIGDDALIGVQAVVAADLPARAWAHTRPHWRAAGAPPAASRSAGLLESHPGALGE